MDLGTIQSVMGTAKQFTPSTLMSNHPLGSFFNYLSSMIAPSLMNRIFNGVSMKDSLGSMLNKQTGAGLTGAEREQNAFNANEALKAREFNAEQATLGYERQRQLTQDQWSLNVQGMQDAGLNPALAYGGVSTPSTPSTASGPAASNGSSQNGMSFSELMAFMTLPLQMEQMKADIDKTHADAANTRQRTETEKYETTLRQIRADYGERYAEQELKNMMIDYEKSASERDKNIASTDYIHSQRDAQEIINRYLPQQQIADLRKKDAETRAKNAEAAYKEWENDFVRANNFLPSSNDYLQIVTYLMDVLGITKPHLFQPPHGPSRDGEGGYSSPTKGDATPAGTSSQGGSR